MLRARFLLLALVLSIGVAWTSATSAAEEEKRKGTVTGIVTAKGPNWIEVKADGEEKARRYTPHWKGGLPKDGGGLDKLMLAEIKKVPLKSRVQVEWSFEERPRVEKIEVLMAAPKE